MRSAIGTALALALLTAGPAHAQDPYLGEQEFQRRCAVCHGATGAGDGPLGELFALVPRDLRTLARQNGGTFPFDRVVQAIDGRTNITAHGPQEMPVWGDFLETEVIEGRGVSPEEAKRIVRERLVALAQYIASLQVE